MTRSASPLDNAAALYNHMVVDILSTTLVAMGDPTRREILARLAAGPATVGSLAAPFKISQQAVSKHLAYLQKAKLVEKRRQGRTNLCTLRPKPFKDVMDWMQAYRRFWDESFDRLDAYLNELQKKKSISPRRKQS